MQTSLFTKYWWQFIILYVIQAFVFKDLEIGFGDSLSIVVFVYPVMILILPLSVSKTASLIVAFAMGFFVDLWYQSPGVHAAALVAMAFARPYVVGLLLDDAEIRTNLNGQSLVVSLPTFMSYAICLYLIHTVLYFLLEQFSLANFGSILLKALFSALFSFIFAMIYRFVVGTR